MRTGETLPLVAARFGMWAETLLAVNGIGAKARVPVGHTLLVPSQSPGAGTDLALKQAVFTTVPQGRTFYYRVNRGDTLTGIAARYAVSPADLRRWNDLHQNTVKIGTRLRITSDLAPNAATSKRATGAPAKPVRVKAKAGGGRSGRSMAKPASSPRR
jgi:LysM repeat protein